MIIIELAEPESEREESHDSFPILEQQTKGAVHHGHHHHQVLPSCGLLAPNPANEIIAKLN